MLCTHTFTASSALVTMFAFHSVSPPASAVLLCHKPIWRRVLRLSAIFVSEAGSFDCYKGLALLSIRAAGFGKLFRTFWIIFVAFLRHNMQRGVH